MRGGVIEGSKSGRPRKTSVREDNLIARMSKADPRLSAPEINREIKANNSIEVPDCLGVVPPKSPSFPRKRGAPE